MTSQTQSKGKSIFVSLLILITLLLSSVAPRAVQAVPAVSTWIEVGSLGTGRIEHTSTLLPDGKVLVAGGINTDTILASAELYDPATGTWSPTGSMT